MAKQSLRKIIEYKGYKSYEEFFEDVKLYVSRLVKIIKKTNSKHPLIEQRQRKLMRLGNDVAHLPYTYTIRNEKTNYKEQHILKLKQYLHKK